MEIVTRLELFERYGYLMDEEHGDDTELLMDIMKCNGIEVGRRGDMFVVTD